MNNDNNIIQILSEKPGLKAKEIARILGLGKKEVNAILHGRLRGKLVQDDTYRWWLKSTEIKSSSSQLRSNATNSHASNEVAINTNYTFITSVPDPGQLVDIRHRRYVVTDVQRSTLPSETGDYGMGGQTHLVTLSSVEDDALGEELQIVWELELGARVFEKTALPEPAGFDDPKCLDAFLDAVRWGAVSSVEDKALQSPFRSGIDIEEYQLDPVVRALQMPRVNLLLADDVGLGKTIEAGLVAQELILRHRVRSILVVCPASIQIQWHDQMRDKFGLEFRIVDSMLMKDLRRRRGLHVNPWTHFPRLITSIDFLKRERPMRLFRETLPAEGEPAYPRRYDLLIVDEAHNVAPSGRGKYATDSDRTKAIREISPHFEHKLFLTATPHNGYPESFSALLELLDSQRFARGVRPNRDQLKAVMIRWMKDELKKKWDGTRRFAERKVKAIEVDYNDAERRAHRLLRQYAEMRHRALTDDSERFATEFILKLLKKRLFSSPEAFAATLEKHEKSLSTTKRGASRAKPSIGLLHRHVEGIDEDYADDDAYEEAADETIEVASQLLPETTLDERKILQELREFAIQASSRPDSKATKLIEWLNDHLKPGGEWSNERVLIFTEYRATQKWLHGLLAAAGFAQNGRLMTLYGGMPSDDRERIKAAFQFDPSRSPVRILLATDAASEGIDLQNHCSEVIHYEIPWNPNRMEQRNGRIDRHGQRSPEVNTYHFVGKGYSRNSSVGLSGELEGDLEFLMKAVLKTEAIRDDLGKVGPVIAAQVEEAMLGRRTILDTTQAEREAKPIREMLKFERKLKEQLEKLYQQLQETKRDLRLSPENIQEVVEIGLELAGLPPLQEVEGSGLLQRSASQHSSCSIFRLPPFSGGWARCSEGLAHPHTGDIRPITFDYSLVDGRDDIVLAHLNHRLVQMCLRLLRAQIWSQGAKKQLHRVTARLISDVALTAPAIIAHGRIVVLGDDNQRIHEEVIAAGGLLKEGRFIRMNVGETKAAIDEALPDEAPEAVKRRLVELWPSYAESLMRSLEVRMMERTKGLQKNIDERTEREIVNMTTILRELERNIKEQIEQPAATQLELWTTPEREQLESNMASLRRRLKEIPSEIEQEAEVIRARYREPNPRLFPVAVTFIIPSKIAREMGGQL